MRSIAIGLGILAGSVLLAQPGLAQTQQAQGKFCLQMTGDASRNCSYATMAACEAARKGQGGNCVENAGTGMKAGAPAGAATTGTGQSPKKENMDKKQGKDQ
jgi:hypothetical protein